MLNTYKGNFICAVYNKAEVFKKFITICILVIEFFNFKNIVSNFSVSLKVYIRELTGRNRNVFKRICKLIINLFAAGCLLCLRSIRREAKNELTQILHFFFCLFLLVVSLSLHNLCHLIPEVVVSAELCDFSKVNIADVSTDCI